MGKAQMINLKNLAPTVLIVACAEAFSSLPPHVPSCGLAFQELDQDANKLITRSDTNSFDGGFKKAVMEELQLANGTINFAQFAVKYCEGQAVLYRTQLAQGRTELVPTRHAKPLSCVLWNCAAVCGWPIHKRLFAGRRRRQEHPRPNPRLY